MTDEIMQDLEELEVQKEEADQFNFVQELKTVLETAPITKLCRVRDRVLDWMHQGETLIDELDQMIESMENENDLGIQTHGAFVLKDLRRVLSHTKGGVQIVTSRDISRLDQEHQFEDMEVPSKTEVPESVEEILPPKPLC